LFAIAVWRAERQKTAVAHVLRRGGRVTYAEASLGEWWLITQARKVLPRDYFASVDRVHFLDSYSEVTDEDVKYVAKLSDLRALALCHTKVTDRGLLHLRVLKKLKWLTLVGNPLITEDGVARLKQELPDCKFS
jgi:hypothetical protein